MRVVDPAASAPMCGARDAGRRLAPGSADSACSPCVRAAAASRRSLGDSAAQRALASVAASSRTQRMQQDLTQTRQPAATRAQPPRNCSVSAPQRSCKAGARLRRSPRASLSCLASRIKRRMLLNPREGVLPMPYSVAVCSRTRLCRESGTATAELLCRPLPNTVA